MCVGANSNAARVSRIDLFHCFDGFVFVGILKSILAEDRKDNVWNHDNSQEHQAENIKLFHIKDQYPLLSANSISCFHFNFWNVKSK